MKNEDKVLCAVSAVCAMPVTKAVAKAQISASDTQSDAVRSQGHVVRFGEWAIGCSHQRVCTAVAPLQGAAMREERLQIGMTFGVEIADPQSIAISSNGEEIDVLSPLAAHLLTEDLQRRKTVPRQHL
jgi:hypothetical protein